jgi:prepilin-type N-terminal cleavage/methylation domain-containing protein
MRIVNNLKMSRQDGFTLIELLMVILVIAILAVIGITQFVNYGKDSRDAATKANLQILRQAIAEKNGMIRVRCAVQDSRFPLTASVSANNILTPAYDGTSANSPCQSSDVPVTADQLFTAAGIPVNPWSVDIRTNPGAANSVYNCQASDPPTSGSSACTRSNTTCGATAAGNGWCYDPLTGEIWANSANNDGSGVPGTPGTTGTEYTF